MMFSHQSMISQLTTYLDKKNLNEIDKGYMDFKTKQTERKKQK